MSAGAAAVSGGAACGERAACAAADTAEEIAGDVNEAAKQSKVRPS